MELAHKSGIRERERGFSDFSFKYFRKITQLYILIKNFSYLSRYGQG